MVAMGAHFEFESVRELGQTIGIEPVDRGHVTGFPTESDWGIYRGEGFGHRGLTDGWLVAFAMANSRPKMFSDSPSIERGAIVAHEIIADHRTGRCLLLVATGHQFGPVLPEGNADPAAHDRSAAAMVSRPHRRCQRQQRDRASALELNRAANEPDGTRMTSSIIS